VLRFAFEPDPFLIDEIDKKTDAPAPMSEPGISLPFTGIRNHWQTSVRFLAV
jgi:hypothetical protein